MEPGRRAQQNPRPLVNRGEAEERPEIGNWNGKAVDNRQLSATHHLNMLRVQHANDSMQRQGERLSVNRHDQAGHKGQ